MNRNTPDLLYKMKLPGMQTPLSAGEGSRNKTDLEQRNGVGAERRGPCRVPASPSTSGGHSWAMRLRLALLSWEHAEKISGGKVKELKQTQEMHEGDSSSLQTIGNSPLDLRFFSSLHPFAAKPSS